MKLYDSGGPNPKVVRMFLAEKNLTIPTVKVDMAGGENRKPAHLARNPSGTLPVLETNAGNFISEVTAICEYLEELHPTPALIGATPEERAVTRMWVRKLDLGICEPMANAFRFSEGLSFFRDRLHTEPEAAPGLKRLVQVNLKWLDAQLEGKTWIVGSRFTLADILLYAFINFFSKNGQPLDPALERVGAWFQAVKARPSSAS